jgi:hypothetical protein
VAEHRLVGAGAVGLEADEDVEVDAAEARDRVVLDRVAQDRDQLRAGGERRARDLRRRRELGVVDVAAAHVVRRPGVAAPAAALRRARRHRPRQPARRRRIGDQRADLDGTELGRQRVVGIERHDLLRRLGGHREDPQVDHDRRILEAAARPQRRHRGRDEPGGPRAPHHCPRTPMVGRIGTPVTGADSR